MCLAVPGELVEIREDTDPLKRSGRVSFGGVLKEVSLAYVPEARQGDYVIVHVGFALQVLDSGEAQRVFSYLEQMGETAEIRQPEDERA